MSDRKETPAKVFRQASSLLLKMLTRSLTGLASSVPRSAVRAPLGSLCTFSCLLRSGVTHLLRLQLSRVRRGLMQVSNFLAIICYRLHTLGQIYSNPHPRRWSVSLNTMLTILTLLLKALVLKLASLSRISTLLRKYGL